MSVHSPDPKTHVTRILIELADESADKSLLNDRLYEAVYGDLRRMATRLMRGESPGHTLQPTALVHEAYLRLVDQSRVQWKSRAHFLAIAARVMRRVLVDHSRKKARLKRGGARQRITWDEALVGREDPSYEIVALDEALRRLEEHDPRMVKTVELRVFGGMTIKEIACVLGVSIRTIHDDWKVAKLWLAEQLAG